MKYDSYVIYADYDFTLTDMQDHMHKGNVKCVEEFIENSGHFAIATGRGEEEMHSIHIRQNAPEILHNGAYIGYPSEEPLFHILPDQKEIQALSMDLYQRYKNLGIFVFADQIYKVRETDIHTKEIISEMDMDTVLKEINAKNVKIQRVSLDAHSEVIDQAKQYIDENYPMFQAMYSAPGHSDVMIHGINKGYAIKWLKEHYYNHGEKILCAGDNVNDIEMLKEADVSFVPGNGVEEAKKYADVILPDCDTPVIGEIMKWIQKNEA